MFFPMVALRTAYGAPISRKRIYLLMIREDMLNDEVQNTDDQGFEDYLRKKLDDMKAPKKTGWFLSLMHVGSEVCQ